MFRRDLETLMSLGSVIQTAVSGMLAATTSVRVTSNNVANVRTLGFKASRPLFATQPFSTIRPGSPPSAAMAKPTRRKLASA